MVLHAVTELYRLRRNEWLSPQALEKIQWRKLKRLLRHAYENVPYYHRLFKTAGIRPEDIKSHQDLSKVPITTKVQLQALAPEEIMARGIDRSKCIEIRTSGSTGRPLNIYLAQKEREFFDIVWTRGFMGAGLSWKDKKVHIRNVLREPITCKYWFQSLGIMRREYIPLVGNEEFVAKFLEKGDFDILVSYPALFRIIIGRMKQDDRLRRGPRLVFSAGELLDVPIRRKIEDYFQAPVFNFYGIMEGGLIAWECAPHRGFHINTDIVVLEIVRDGKVVESGERGRIVATGLHSYSMPFIRYDTEDVGVLSDRRCPCGRSLPLLEGLEGRCNDFVSLPDGRVLPPGLFISLCNLDEIVQYRIVQEKIDELIVYLVLESNTPTDLAKCAKEKIKAWVGETMTIRMKIVDEIPPDRSGKLRSVISYVPLSL